MQPFRQRVIETDTLGGALRSLMTYQIEHESPDVVMSIETHLRDVVLMAKRPMVERDLGKNLGLTHYRWTRLVRDYLDEERLKQFVDHARMIYTGDSREGATTMMHFNDPKRSRKKHRWGGCLGTITYRGTRDSNLKNDEPTLVVTSRTFYIGFMGFLDGAIIAHIAREITGKWLNYVRVIWYVADSQLPCFKCLPYVFTNTPLMERLKKIHRLPVEKTSPGWFYVAKWYNYILRDYKKHGTKNLLAKEKYGQLRRVKEVWLEAAGKIETRRLSSIPFSTLDFSPLGGVWAR